MAAGWLTALKIIPWGDVIEAAPGLAKGARNLFKRTQDAVQADAPPADEPPPNADAAEAAALAHRRIAELEVRLHDLTERQQSAAALLESLATQNAQLVVAVDALRRRGRLMWGAIGVLALACGGLAAWVASRMP